MLETLGPLGLFDGAIFSNVLFFVVIITAIGFGIGSLSGSPAIALLGAWLLFLPIASRVDIALLSGIMYVIATLMALAVAFMGYEFVTGSSGAAG